MSIRFFADQWVWRHGAPGKGRMDSILKAHRYVQPRPRLSHRHLRDCPSKFGAFCLGRYLWCFLRLCTRTASNHVIRLGGRAGFRALMAAGRHDVRKLCQRDGGPAWPLEDAASERGTALLCLTAFAPELWKRWLPSACCWELPHDRERLAQVSKSEA
jgi:hypothetical protein